MSIKNVLFPIFFSYVLFANPSGEKISYGNINFSRDDKNLTIVQGSKKAIINWKDFSIKDGELTRFIQKEGASCLNRVFGDSPSTIYGTLKADSRIFLLNQNGILVGDFGVIDTKGFFASTLNMSDEDFIKGEGFHLKDGKGASFENRGEIISKEDVLIASKIIKNSGRIKALENIYILAGEDIYINNNDLTVKVSGVGGATNKGALEAAIVKMEVAGGMGSLAINQSGLVEASGLREVDGKIILSSGKGTIYIDGKMKARSGEDGGSVHVLGHDIIISKNTLVDISGESGGEALVGGDYKGSNPLIPNAKNIFMEKGAKIDADAGDHGDGGKVILWADDSNYFGGEIYARGGKISGDGGFVEISSKGFLNPVGNVFSNASNGKMGTLLFDPIDVTISGAADSNVTSPTAPPPPPPDFGPYSYVFASAATANINVSNLATFLAYNNVTIDSNQGSGGAGDIDITSALSWSTSTTLTLNAYRSLYIDAAISNTHTGSGTWTAINFTANSTGISGNFSGMEVTVGGGSIQSSEGNIILTGTGGSGAYTTMIGIDARGSISSTGTGADAATITMNGTGGSGTSYCIGVFLYSVTSVDGDISITGAGRGSSAYNHGVDIFTSRSVTSTGTGTDAASITINGTVTSSVNYSRGVWLESGAFIESERGNITVTGNASGGSALGCNGVRLNDATIRHSPSNVYTKEINITGTAGGTSGIGIEVDNSSIYSSGANTSITLTGTGVGASGLDLKSSSVIGNGVTADITLVADTMALTSVTVDGTNDLVVSPLNASTSMGLGNSSSGTLQLTAAELATLSSSFASKEFGHSSATGDVDLRAQSYDTPLIIRGGDTHVNGTITSSSNDTVTMYTSSDFYLNNGISTTDTVTINGTSGSDNNFNISYTGSQTATFNGVGGTNTIVAPNIPNSWNITSANGGTLNTNYTFVDVQNLTGNSSSDTFIFSNGASVSGDIDGAGGSNAISYASYLTPVSVNLQTGTSTGCNTFANIQTFTGGSGSDTMIGQNALNSWNITSNNAGNIGGSITFSSFENLTGGTAADTFTFSNGVSLSGDIDGAGGANAVSYASYLTPVSVNLQTGASTGCNTLTNIQTFTGGAGSDTIIGPDSLNTWNITSNNAGNIGGVITFSSFENLTGVTGNDTFIFSSGVTVSGIITGGGSSSNVLDYSSYGAPITVNFTTNTATGTGGFVNIQRIIGSSFSDTVVGPASNNNWYITDWNVANINNTIFLTNIENLTGGSGNDTFIFSDQKGVYGNIDGGSPGFNTLDYSYYTTDVDIDLDAGTATGTGGILNIQNIIYPLFLYRGIDTQISITLDMRDKNSMYYYYSIYVPIYPHIDGNNFIPEFYYRFFKDYFDEKICFIR